MKKTCLYTLAAALGFAGLAETAPLTAGVAEAAAPRSLEELRAEVRGDAMARLALGEVDEVRRRRGHRRRYVAPRYSMGYVHRRGRWCGKGRWVGRRCYYTPRVLKPFRR